MYWSPDYRRPWVVSPSIAQAGTRMYSGRDLSVRRCAVVKTQDAVWNLKSFNPWEPAVGVPGLTLSVASHGTYPIAFSVTKVKFMSQIAVIESMSLDWTSFVSEKWLFSCFSICLCIAEPSSSLNSDCKWGREYVIISIYKYNFFGFIFSLSIPVSFPSQ